MLGVVRFPELDSSTTKGVLLRYLVEPGAAIARGQDVAEVETEKASFNVPAPCGGKVVALLLKANAEIEVGAPLLTLETDEAGAEAFSPEKTAAPKSPAPQARAGLYACSEPGRALFNANARSTAPEVPVALNAPTDVARFVARGVAVTEERRLVGAAARTHARMLWSAAHIPTATVTMSYALSALQNRVDAAKADKKLTLHPTDVLVWAAARALRGFPDLNAYRDGDLLRCYQNINPGVVYALQGELVVPAIPQADRLSVRELSSALRELYRHVTARNLPPRLLGISTFTISNMFGAGVVHATPIVNPGQTAVLLIGAPLQQDGAAHVNLVLGFDHAAVNGLRASAFLKALTRQADAAEI